MKPDVAYVIESWRKSARVQYNRAMILRDILEQNLSESEKALRLANFKHHAHEAAANYENARMMLIRTMLEDQHNDT